MSILELFISFLYIIFVGSVFFFWDNHISYTIPGFFNIPLVLQKKKDV